MRNLHWIVMGFSTKLSLEGFHVGFLFPLEYSNNSYSFMDAFVEHVPSEAPLVCKREQMGNFGLCFTRIDEHTSDISVFTQIIQDKPNKIRYY